MGRGAAYCWSDCLERIPQGLHLGSTRVFLVGGSLTCCKPPALKDSKVGSINNLNSCGHIKWASPFSLGDKTGVQRGNL